MSAKFEEKQSRRGGFKRLWKLLAVLIILAGIGAVFWYQMDQNNKLKQENARLADPQAVAQQESDKIKADIAKLIELPKDEQPTIATVVDAGKLKNQAFFKNAENGDKVLIFSQAKKAILYRPSTNKIIEVAPINIGENQQATPAEGTPNSSN